MSKKKDFFKSLYNRFIKIRGDPHDIGLGFALGIFIGLTPTMGLQIALAIFFAALLKWNKISAILAVWVTNPFTAPFIYSSTYLVGAKILGRNNGLNFPDEFSVKLILNILSNAPKIFGTMVLGGVIIGIPLSIISYFVTFYAVRKYRENVRRVFIAQREKIKKRRMMKKKAQASEDI